jgi:trigger factor
MKHDLQVKFKELKDYAKEMITLQMAQYGQSAPQDEELDGIVTKVMSNQEETQRMSDQLMSNKLLDFFKTNVPLKEKKVTFDAFVKEAYGKA